MKMIEKRLIRSSIFLYFIPLLTSSLLLHKTRKAISKIIVLCNSRYVSTISPSQASRRHFGNNKAQPPIDDNSAEIPENRISNRRGRNSTRKNEFERRAETFDRFERTVLNRGIYGTVSLVAAGSHGGADAELKTLGARTTVSAPRLIFNKNCDPVPARGGRD